MAITEASSSKHFMTPLWERCIKVVADNFEANPNLEAVPSNLRNRVISLLSIDLPLELVRSSIPNKEEYETYWKRRSLAQWKNCEVSAHGNSWKQLFFERYVETSLEQFDPTSGDPEELLNELRRLLSFSSKYVRSLNIKQLPSHLDLQEIFNIMNSTLAFLSISYNMRNVGIDYDRSLFGMKLSDCRSLAKALERTETLTYLNLSSNMLDDDKIRMIASGMVDNISVTHLDLSHNKIADRGARALAKLLDSQSVITVLDLCGNQLHSEGGKALSNALIENESLINLGLRLNRLGDEGGRAICEALSENETLEKLNMSSNACGHETAIALANTLRINSTLVDLNLSCNDLGEEGGRAIQLAMEENTSVKTLDVRLSNIGEDQKAAIASNCRNHYEE